MMRYISLVLTTLTVLIAGCSLPESTSSAKPQILVSSSPYHSLVKRIVGETAQVNLLLPQGASMHFFEPSPRQVGVASQADIWFRLGEQFERPALEAIKSGRPHMRIIDLRDGIELLAAPEHHHHGHDHDHGHNHHDEYDLHIWTSPKRVKQQVTAIIAALVDQYPQFEERYTREGNQLVADLDRLDKRLTHIFEFATVRTIMVSHPAYGYLCADYGFEQLSIEQEGKDPTPKTLSGIINVAKEKKIRRIFVQPQHSAKGAKLIADSINAQVVEIDPFDSDYFDNMRKIAWKFAGAY